MPKRRKKKGHKIKRTKEQSQNVHARRRFMQRFGIPLTKERKAEILAKIQMGHAHFVEKQSNRISIFDVFLEGSGTKVRIVYDKNRHNIVSVLYPEGIDGEGKRLPEAVVASSDIGR